VEKIKPHTFSVTFLFRKSCLVKKCCSAKQATDDNIIRRMRFACWITKATNTHSECVILTAFPWQQWLRERASMLHYMHIACFVLSLFLSNHPTIRHQCRC
jgi:hypothetical protein